MSFDFYPAPPPIGADDVMAEYAHREFHEVMHKARAEFETLSGQINAIAVLLGGYDATTNVASDTGVDILDASDASYDSGNYYIVTDPGTLPAFADISGLATTAGDSIHVTDAGTWFLVKQDTTHETDFNNPHQVSHAQTTGKTPNDHHAQSHAHLGDGSGTVDHTSLTTIGTKTHLQLETDISDLDASILLMRSVIVEKLYLNGPTTETAGNITDYTSIDTHPDGVVTADLNTGLITIGVSGYYRITGYISMFGTGNNSWYGLSLEVDSTPILLIGGIVWSNQWTGGGAINGIFHGDLVAGQTVNLAWSTVSAVINPSEGQFGVELMFKA